MADGLRGLAVLAASSPIILALATAAGAGSAAVVRGDETLSLRRAADARDHAADVLDLVDGALCDAGLSLAGVDGFAVAIGPGSFTRLRVGLATVKGLAFGGTRKVAPVSTLVAMAEAAAADAPEAACLAPALDARRRQLYGAAFERSAEAATGWDVRLPESVYAIEAWPGLVPAAAVLVGEGAALCEDAPHVRHPERGGPCASAVGRVGGRLHARGEAVEAGALVPRYLRRAEAEARRLAL